MAELRSIQAELERYAGGDDDAANEICASLEVVVREVVIRTLSPDDPDADDVAQDSLIAFLRYLRESKSVPVNPRGFVVTVARNRCLNLVVWRRRRRAENVDDVAERIADPQATPLDFLEEEDRHRLLRDALERISPRCAELLTAIFQHEIPMQDLRKRLDLKSVQAVYYRRDSCLKELQQVLNRTLLVGHGDRDGQPARRHEAGGATERSDG